MSVRSGLDLVLDRYLPLGGAVVSKRPVALELAAPREPGLGGLFDDRGRSLVAGCQRNITRHCNRRHRRHGAERQSHGRRGQYQYQPHYYY